MNICKFVLSQTILSARKTTFASIANLSTLTSALCPTSRFLKPQILSAQPNAGLKHVVNPRRRCLHCYMVFEDEYIWVFCDKYPRHKQVTRKSKSDLKNQMIMTHATQGGKQKHGSRGRMGMWTQSSLRLDF